MRDLFHNVGAALALPPAVQTGTVTGSAIDLKGFNSAVVVINTGANVGDGIFSVQLQESETTTSGDFTDVFPSDLQVDAQVAVLTPRIGFPDILSVTLTPNSVFSLGYIGPYRYIRAKLTKTSGTSMAIGAIVVKGHPDLALPV